MQTRQKISRVIAVRCELMAVDLTIEALGA